MYKLIVALRYLRRNRLNLIGVIAVAIGVLALISVLSVMKGFDQELRGRVRATLSDLIIEDWYGEPFGDYQALMEKLERIPHVAACAPEYAGVGLAQLQKSHSQYCAFRGIDLAREVKTTEFAEDWREWRGRAAREEMQGVFTEGVGLTGSDDTIKYLLKRLRHKDFDFLDQNIKSALRDWAKNQSFDLEAAFQAADGALPEWPTVSEPESPAFLGGEMLVVGRSLSGAKVTLGLGDRVLLTTVANVSAAEELAASRLLKRCRVAGGFVSGMYDYDNQTLCLPLKDVQKLMSKPESVTSVNVRLDSYDNAPQVRAEILGIMTASELEQGLKLVYEDLAATDSRAARTLREQIALLRARSESWFTEGDPTVLQITIQAETALLNAVKGAAARLEGAGAGSEQKLKEIKEFGKRLDARISGGIGFQKFRISTWEDKRIGFLRAVGLERKIMAVILFFMLLIAGLLILSNLLTTVVSKTRDIGTLKSVGGSVRGIMSIFLLNGLLIGVVGSGLGALGGILITRNINEIEHFLHRMIGFSLFPQDTYLFDKIPVDQQPFGSILVICLVAVGVSLLAAAYPAWRASRLDAVEALRYE